jgi:putative hydrolase of the HAD superfamily
MRPPIRAAVFDLDDTLYPEEEFCRSGFRAAGSWIERSQGVPGFADAAWALFREGRRGDVFQRALLMLGRSADPDLIGRLVEVYRTHEPSGLELFPDARQALGRLSRTLRLGLLTDGFLGTQKAKVRSLGLEGRFEAAVFSDELGRDAWKPSPRPYLETASRLSLSGEECAYIADNPLKDFTGARPLGWLTIRVLRPGGVYSGALCPPGAEPHRTVESLDGIEDILGSCDSWR